MARASWFGSVLGVWVLATAACGSSGSNPHDAGGADRGPTDDAPDAMARGGAGGGSGGNSSGGSGVGGGMASTGGRGVGGGMASTGGSGIGGDMSGGGGSGGGGGLTGSGGSPPQTLACTAPVAGQPEDSSHPTTVVGDGSPASCTAAALDAAVQKAGVITFNCGPDPVTISVAQQIRINNQGGGNHLGDTLIDGGGKVTLDGGGASRILYLNACQPPYNSDHCDTFEHPHLTLQNLAFAHGSVEDPKEGGGAVFANGGLLKVVNAKFTRNHCAMVGQEVKGGAIDTFLQSKPVYIVDSSFTGNDCQSGGALGSIGTSYTIINSIISGNQATLGSGGGIANDGGTYNLVMCGSVLSNNSANDYGGGLFYVSNDGTGTTTIDSTTVSGNTSTAKSHTGGLYLQGTAAVIRATTISGNMAGFAAGLFVHPNATGNSLTLVNSTVTGNTGTALVIDPNIGGMVQDSTIAGNQSGISGGATVTLKNAIVANNGSSNCDVAHPSGGGNLQFPQAGTACTRDALFGDPQLGALGNNGGPTQTMKPAAGSPALGAGNGCPATDQRGVSRPANGCASGAVEPP